MSPYRRWLASPAAPALLLLFGLVFGFAGFHLAGLQWSPMATRVYYLGLFLWGGAVCVMRWPLLRQTGLVDGLFLLFLLLVVVSLAVQYESNPAATYYGKLLPFLVLLPYCLGRLVEAEDFATILRILPWLALLLLLLSILDYCWISRAETVHARVRFFGMDHSPLLMAMLVSTAQLALGYRLANPDNKGAAQAWLWIVFGVMTIAAVIVAARGALFAYAIALALMLAWMPCPMHRKARIIVCFVTSVAIGFLILPTPQTQLYGRLITLIDAVPVAPSVNPQTEDERQADYDLRCKPFIDGLNSVSMRRVLFQEALDLSLQNPTTGVGASSFGKYSCGGVGSYPHSTVLQAFAELGVVGGLLLVALMVTSVRSLARAFFAMKKQSAEPAFWLALLCFFSLTDQIYGNYFMASGSSFLFGVAARLHVRSDPLVFS